MKLATTKYGVIEGVEKTGYSLFCGIPYAEPPVGELRWKAPRPVKPWEGVYRADRFRARGWQENDTEGEVPFWKEKLLKEFYDDPRYTPEMSEDMLYLNIWTPAKQAGEKLPVAFWVHGGGFGSGWSWEKEFDGEAYCGRGVILVTIAYRLGMWGNLVHPWLNAENEHGVSGNYGILDQIEALKWVYDNIEAFGGDSDNITVFGQSAGAMSTQFLVSTELTGNRIAKAIFQSGGAHNNEALAGRAWEKSMEIGREFVEETKAGSLEELRAMPADRLELLAEAYSAGKQEGILFMPVADGYVFSENTTDCLENGHVKQIPYMLGTTENDLFVTPEMLERGEKTTLYKGCVEWSQKTEELWNQPSYVYYFKRHLPGDDWGAFHCAELWYMFGTLDRCWRPFEEQDRKLSREMLEYWVNFMKTGKPADAEEWRPCTRADAFVKVLE